MSIIFYTSQYPFGYDHLYSSNESEFSFQSGAPEAELQVTPNQSALDDTNIKLDEFGMWTGLNDEEIWTDVWNIGSQDIAYPSNITLTQQTSEADPNRSEPVVSEQPKGCRSKSRRERELLKGCEQEEENVENATMACQFMWDYIQENKNEKTLKRLLKDVSFVGFTRWAQSRKQPGERPPFNLLVGRISMQVFVFLKDKVVASTSVTFEDIKTEAAQLYINSEKNARQYQLQKSKEYKARFTQTNANTSQAGRIEGSGNDSKCVAREETSMKACQLMWDYIQEEGKLHGVGYRRFIDWVSCKKPVPHYLTSREVAWPVFTWLKKTIPKSQPGAFNTIKTRAIESYVRNMKKYAAKHNELKRARKEKLQNPDIGQNLPVLPTDPALFYLQLEQNS